MMQHHTQLKKCMQNKCKILIKKKTGIGCVLGSKKQKKKKNGTLVAQSAYIQTFC